MPPSQQPSQVMTQRAILAKEEWFHGPISRYFISSLSTLIVTFRQYLPIICHLIESSVINFDLLTIRRDAEQLLRYDGDFLVRESQQPGQFVLTGMQVMEACDWLVLIILTSHWSSGQWEEASATCGSRGSCQVRNLLENRRDPFNPSSIF